MQSRNPESLGQWLRENGRTSLCIVSPHLDDAVYSAFTALTDGGAAVPREVVTVVTSATTGVQTRWSTLSGFSDTHAEHRERSREDQQVLQKIRVDAVHLGGLSENAQSLKDRLAEFAAARTGTFGHCAFLLPGGAGRQSGFSERVWRRLRRRYDARASHPEHVLVRDVMTRVLLRQPDALWGYYAEIPYIWNDVVEALQRRLMRLAHSDLNSLQLHPEPQAKYDAAVGYRSQVNLAMGADQASQLRFCSHPELLFLQAGFQRPRVQSEIVGRG